MQCPFEPGGDFLTVMKIVADTFDSVLDKPPEKITDILDTLEMPPSEFVSCLNEGVREERKANPDYDPTEDLARFGHYFSKYGFVYDSEEGRIREK